MLAMLIVVLSLSGTTRAELWVANAACGFHADLLAPGHNWNGPKQSELKKKKKKRNILSEVFECRSLNIGIMSQIIT